MRGNLALIVLLCTSFLCSRIGFYHGAEISLLAPQHILNQIQETHAYMEQEISLLEITQTIFLFSALVLHFKYRRLMLENSNIFAYLLRVSMFLFLFYEEISFITAGTIPQLDSLNVQSELNFHNLTIFAKYRIAENINIPILNYTFTLIFPVAFFSMALAFIGFGSYMRYFSKIRLLFLEKRYSIYSLVFILNIILSSVLINKFNFLGLRDGDLLIGVEFVELFIYVLLFFDTTYKIKFMKSAR